jgi:hypothetical protein
MEVSGWRKEYNHGVGESGGIEGTGWCHKWKFKP